MCVSQRQPWRGEQRQHRTHMGHAISGTEPLSLSLSLSLSLWIGVISITILLLSVVAREALHAVATQGSTCACHPAAGRQCDPHGADRLRWLLRVAAAFRCAAPLAVAHPPLTLPTPLLTPAEESAAAVSTH